MNKLSQPVYRIVDIEVDASTGGLRCGDRERHLRQQTFQVLIYLILQRHRLETKEELMDTIWPETAVTQDGLVECIVDIGNALGDDSRQPQFVKTIPGVDYRFIGSVEEPSRTYRRQTAAPCWLIYGMSVKRSPPVGRECQPPAHHPAADAAAHQALVNILLEGATVEGRHESILPRS